MTSESPQQNQVRRVVLYDEVLANGLFSERRRVVNGLPEDAEFVRMFEDASTGTYSFIFRSSKFSPVGVGEEIPEFEVVFEDFPRYSTGGGR